MNFLLLLYLSYVRGPRLLQEQREREGNSNRKVKNSNKQSTCKKCDGKLNETDIEVQQPEEWCLKCRNGTETIYNRKNVNGSAPQKTGLFIWFQVCGICVALVVFVYRTFSQM
uniref:AlNc14C125G6782 protein n=1 Tax=Albugo laibachii Nc14 TaxID=890382 RepID=F0WJQ6_9STRA|nr:AlNc14C125G6782 [Albugo laibachii Nc14]|eukprot:CCA21507.1 AlNc14C125G6782 [Albugo laibachii Nc14]